MNGLTAFSGEPMMCVIIIEGELSHSAIEVGIDITVTPKESLDDDDFIFKNNGSGCSYPGGPECYSRGERSLHLYNGTKVPASLLIYL